MTIIVWDGESLYTDRRRTKKCPLGGPKMSRDGTVKIDVNFRGCKFKGEAILAVATSGNVGMTKMVKDKLTKHKDVVRTLTTIHDGGRSDDWKKCSLLIVTPSTAYRLSLSKGQAPVLVEIGNTFVAIGSGAKAAEALYKTLRLQPRLLVTSVGLGSVDSCGGGYSFLRRKGNGVTGVKSVHAPSRVDVLTRLKKAVESEIKKAKKEFAELAPPL